MKKTFAFLISLSLLFNLCVADVFAQNVQNEADNQNFELLGALGIDDDVNTDLSAYVTRAEFTAMAVRAVNMAKHNSYDGSFGDVGEGYPFVNEIYTAKNLRMTNGTADGVFSPNDTVSLDVALKIMLVAMGYETMAVTFGGFPYGYQRIEAQLDITSGVSASAAITVSDAKTIITNALKEDMAVFSGIENGNVIYSQTKGMNLLTERFNLRNVSGIVTKAGVLSADMTFDDEPTVIISGNTYKAEGIFDKFFGTYVSAWVGNDNDKVYAMEYTGQSKIVSFDAENVVSHTNHKLTVTDDDKTRYYTTAAGISFIENGRVISHSDDDFVFPDGILSLIDTEGDGIYDYAISEKKEYFVITSINLNNEIICDKNSSLGYVELNEKSGSVRRIFDSNGATLEFSSLSVDKVVEVYKSRDELITTVVVSDSSKIEAMVTEKGTGIVVAGETQYKTNTYFDDTGISVIPGETYALYIAGDGTLTYAKRAGSSDISYGYFLAFKRTGGLESKTAIKLLTSANTVEVYNIADKLTFDGHDGVSCEDARLDSAFVNGKYFKYQLIRYALNNEGKINMIDTCAPSLNQDWEMVDNADIDNSLTQYIDDEIVQYHSGTGCAIPHFSFKNAVIFVAPAELKTNANQNFDDTDFAVEQYTTLKDKDNCRVDVFDFGQTYNPGAIIMYKTVSGGNFDYRGSCHLVYSVTDAVNPDGEETKLIRSYSGGKYYRYFVAPDKVGNFTLPNPGDLALYSFDFNNYIVETKSVAVYDAEAKSADCAHDGAYNTEMSLVSGTVVTMGDGNMVIRASSLVSGTTLHNTSNIMPLKFSSPSYAIYDTKTCTVTKASEADIMTEEIAGTSGATKVLCRLNYFMVKDVIIYR